MRTANEKTEVAFLREAKAKKAAEKAAAAQKRLERPVEKLQKPDCIKRLEEITDELPSSWQTLALQPLTNSTR